MRQILQAIGQERVLKITDVEASVICEWAWWLRHQYDDLRQEGLVKVCEAAVRCTEEFHSRSKAEQYVYLRSAARSGCISYVRKQKRHHDGRVSQPVEWFLEAQGFVPSPERSHLATERIQELQDVFVELMVIMSPREREAFLWRLGVGPEIDVSKWTARTYADRARAKLIRLVERKKIEWLTVFQIERLFRL